MRILALDTATENCSAALLINGFLTGRELELGRGHAERILGMIDELLAEGGIGLTDLDAIAFGRGPGGFTGVRLAASVTQGLAFGAGLPVVPVSDLLAVAQRALTEGTAAGRLGAMADTATGTGNAPGSRPRPVTAPGPPAAPGPSTALATVSGVPAAPGALGATPNGTPKAIPAANPGTTRVLVCSDARMHEVYWACFERANEPGALASLVGEERVGRPETVTFPAGWTSPVVRAGRGFAAYPALRARLAPSLEVVHDRLLPRAHEIATLAVPILQAGAAVDAERAIPVYLRDDVAQPAER